MERQDRTHSSDGMKLYANSGVQVEKADKLVDWLKGDSTDIGGFAGCFSFDWKQFDDPLLVSSTDGVGTKVLLAVEQNQLAGIGQDLVAMCVNDLYTVGARPLFFLDYYGCGRLDEAQFKVVVAGMKKALAACGCALLGGETAELPGLYQDKHFDLAGFVVGVVEKSKKLPTLKMTTGSRLIALPSSGFHSNGYSLLRNWMKSVAWHSDLIEKILTPTRIYHFLPQLIKKSPLGSISGLAHITGGGIDQNLMRVIPDGLQARVDFEKIVTPDWMQEIFHMHRTSAFQLREVFNLGVGMIAIVQEEHAKQFLKDCQGFDCKAYDIGFLDQSFDKQKIAYC